MSQKKTIVFSHSLRGYGEHNKVVEEVEFDLDATDEEISKAFEEWVWEQIGDYCTWYEKE